VTNTSERGKPAIFLDYLSREQEGLPNAGRGHQRSDREP
jgi:hypothetical protein